jgi:hypothetical protein
LGLNDARQLLDESLEFLRIGLNQETRSYLAEHSQLHLQPRVWPHDSHRATTFKLYFHQEGFNTLRMGEF